MFLKLAKHQENLELSRRPWQDAYAESESITDAPNEIRLEDGMDVGNEFRTMVSN
jgi:hypothetical protein